jgi:phosphate transport system permease protein
LPSLIANGFIEAPTPIEKSAYVGAALILLLTSIVINVLAYLMVTRVLKVKGGAVE